MSQDPSRRPGAGPGSEGDHLDHVGAMMSHTSIKGIAIVDNVLEGMVWDPQHHQEGRRCTEGGLYFCRSAVSTTKARSQVSQ